ncbi:MAG TPA: hypothetical protein VK735_16860 [Pseudonocardia sp.]|uniref:hypothetical protein n=1 Tax=Pseudonocardia sp. TaxID=60912 RepID=UPI002CA855D8|nr:hypothetical protein [Pseudonocardia sp.]HTF49116.1 hypothetical protein [Pseudonocardia sp.]
MAAAGLDPDEEDPDDEPDPDDELFESEEDDEFDEDEESLEPALAAAGSDFFSPFVPLGTPAPARLSVR